MAETINTNCCAVVELHGIEHDTPEETIREYLGNVLDNVGAETPTLKSGDLDAVVNFYSVEKLKRGTNEWERRSTKTGYGTKLAAFIKKNKLGKVVRLPGAYNRVNHPTHFVVPFVWYPSPQGVRSFMAKDKKYYNDNYCQRWRRDLW